MSQFRNGHASKEYKFVIDICSNLQEKSGATCIGDPEEEKQAVESIALIGQEITRFFSPEIEDERKL